MKPLDSITHPSAKARLRRSFSRNTPLTPKAFIGSILLVCCFLLGLTRPAPATGRHPSVHLVGLDQTGVLQHTWTNGSPQFFVTHVRPPIPRSIRIRNNASITVKVALYYNTDAIRLIPFKTWTIRQGSSVTYPMGTYHVKVFKPAFFDIHMATRLNIASDITITGNTSRIGISAQGPKPVTITNRADERLKICIYNSDDRLQIIPKKVWTLSVGQKVTWSNADSEYLLSVFRPAFLDQKLTTRLLPDKADITITHSLFAPWEKTTGVAMLSPDDLSANPDLYTYHEWGGSLYARGADGKLKRRNMSLTFPLFWFNDRMYVWGDWTDTGIPVPSVGAPRVVCSGDTVTGDSVDQGEDASRLFTVDENGNLRTKSLYKWGGFGNLDLVYNTDGAWQNLGGNLAAPPAVVTYHPSAMTVYGRDADNRLCRRMYDDGVWGDWVNLEAQIQGTPAVTWVSTNVPIFAASYQQHTYRQDVFVRGIDNGLWHRTWRHTPQEEGWTTWESLGGTIASSPAAAGFSGNNTCDLYVFARLSDNTYGYRYFDGTRWTEWRSLGGNFRSAPATFRTQRREWF